MLNTVQMVVFDIDGTLFDSIDFNTENLNKSLEAFGFDYRVNQSIVRKHLGCVAEEYYSSVLNEEAFTKWEEMRIASRERSPEMIKAYGRAFDGVYETLKALHEKGITVVLYSNCSRPYLEAAVALLGISDFLDYNECVGDNGLAKPELLAKIIKMYPDKPCVVVGDRIHDYEAAVANHVPCVAALYGYGKEELDVVPLKVEKIADLLKMIG